MVNWASIQVIPNLSHGIESLATPTNRDRLRVGVIGLGGPWNRRHRAAFLKMADQIEVRAIHDQVMRRAAMEAKTFGCAVSGGVAALIDRDDVDAVYLLGSQWFGWYALELAARRGKPIYCALNVAEDPRGFQDVAEVVQRSGAPLMWELARRFAPVTLRLRELLATVLGRPLLIHGTTRLFGVEDDPPSLCTDPGGSLVDWLRFIFQSEVVGLHARGGRVQDHEAETIAVEFADGGLARVELQRHPREHATRIRDVLPSAGFEVHAERGAAWVQPPDLIGWSTADDAQDERLPEQPSVGERLNRHFLRLVRGESALAPTLNDALDVARWIQELQRKEGRPWTDNASGSP